MNNTKIKFNNREDIVSSYSQASQDIFVLSCLNGKKNGTFLDLGCNHPTNINNTFLLEKQFGWSGVSFDIDENLINLFPSSRKTPGLCRDCTKLDFQEVLSYYATNHIDYLSLDLEPASITFECLLHIPFEQIEFSIITFEHDFYRNGNFYREESRKIFDSNGYKIICSNVMNSNNIYEDWYYNPKYVSYENIKILESETKEWSKILYEE